MNMTKKLILAGTITLAALLGFYLTVHWVFERAFILLIKLPLVSGIYFLIAG